MDQKVETVGVNVVLNCEEVRPICAKTVYKEDGLSKVSGIGVPDCNRKVVL